MWKQFIIDAGIDAFLNVLEKRKRNKGKSKLAEFLFSEKMQNTLGKVYTEYNQALDEWEETQEK